MVAPPDPSATRIGGPWRHLDVHANGIRFHVVEAGPADSDAPLVVLLHGFADFWWSWRHQLTGLADAGFRTSYPVLAEVLVSITEHLLYARHFGAMSPSL